MASQTILKYFLTLMSISLNIFLRRKTWGGGGGGGGSGVILEASFFCLKITLKNVKIIKKSNNFVWIEVDKTFFKQMDKNLRIVGTFHQHITQINFVEN